MTTLTKERREDSNKKYRAVIHNANNGNEKIESIWFNTEAEAIKAGTGGTPFYGGTEFTIETKESK